METREPNTDEVKRWNDYRAKFEGSTKPKVQALVFWAKLANEAQNAASAITGTPVKLIDDETATRINTLGHYAQILDNQITGVLLKKYGVQFPDNGDIQIVASPANFDEGDVLPSFSGFGVAPFLIVAGIAGVVLLAGGFITLKIIEERTKNESARLMKDMADLDAKMMQRPKEDREQWDSWKAKAAKQAAAAAKNIPGASGLLQNFLGKKGATIAIAAAAGIAALYFLSPNLRRN
jgi:outer membrane murein-binding lipoprotein Lpp